MTAYEWLSDRYHDGDKIFLFGMSPGCCIRYAATLKMRSGFSRGAYQVRALAGMIHEVPINFKQSSLLLIIILIGGAYHTWKRRANTKVSVFDN